MILVRLPGTSDDGSQVIFNSGYRALKVARGDVRPLRATLNVAPSFKRLLLPAVCIMITTCLSPNPS